MESTKLNYKDSTAFELKLSVLPNVENADIVIKTIPMSVVKSGDSYKLNDVGISLKLVKYWLPFKERLANVFIDFGESSIAVFKGIGSLFTGVISDLCFKS